MSTCDFNCTNTRDKIQTRTAWECRWHFQNSLARWPSASLGWKSFIDWKADRESGDIKIQTNIDFVFDRRLYKGKVTMGRSLRYQCNSGRWFTSSMLLRWKGARLRWQCFRTVYFIMHYHWIPDSSQCEWSRLAMSGSFSTMEWVMSFKKNEKDDWEILKLILEGRRRRLGHIDQGGSLRLVVRVEKKLINYKSIDISTITVPVTRVAALTNSEAAWTTYIGTRIGRSGRRYSVGLPLERLGCLSEVGCIP